MSTALEVNLISPFINSTMRAFNTMLGWELRPQTPEVNTHFHPRYEVSGVIGLSGKMVGTLVLSVEKEVALAAAEVLTQQKYEQLTEDVIDTMGEITNIVGGGAKAELAEYALNLSLPTVIIGRNHLVTFISNVQTVLVPFECDAGEIAIEVGMSCK